MHTAQRGQAAQPGLGEEKKCLSFLLGTRKKLVQGTEIWNFLFHVVTSTSTGSTLSAGALTGLGSPSGSRHSYVSAGVTVDSFLSAHGTEGATDLFLAFLSGYYKGTVITVVEDDH